MATTVCPVCAQPDISAVLDLYDDRYGYPGSFELLSCATCAHRWLRGAPSSEELATLYSCYYPRSFRSIDDFAPLRISSGLLGWWRGQRSSASSWVPERVRVLDIGCGFGESLAYHRARGCEVAGVEADRNIARVAQHYGFDVHVGLFSPDRYAPASFDYVTMDQVLEHMIDPLDTLRGIRSILKPTGQLVLSTPNASSFSARLFGRRWIHWHAPYHLHFFSPASLRIIAQRAGLAIEKMQTTTSSEWINYQWIHALTCPKAGEHSPFWSGQRPRTLRQSVLVKLLRGAHRFGGDHALTRGLDALGLGDNYIIHMKPA